MPEPHDTAILALDASTASTGAALVTFTAAGAPTLVSHNAYDAAYAMKSGENWPTLRGIGTDAQRLWRLSETAFDVGLWADCLLAAVEVVAYEEPCQRGAANTAAIHQAIGAYLVALPRRYSLLPLVKVNATSAKSCTIGGTIRAKGQTAESLDEKTRMRRWVCEHVGGAAEVLARLPVPEQEAVSDACAVAVAAYRALQRPPKAPKPRKPKSPKVVKP
jgi:hypothetical protein